MKAKHRFFSGVLGIAIGLGLLAGCGKKDDPITQAEKKDADKPGMVAIKDTVKEAYIYGFPMLMNYGVMHAYFIDRNSGQFKAPFNRFSTKRECSRPKTLPLLRPTATPRIHSSGWTCGRSPSCCAFPR